MKRRVTQIDRGANGFGIRKRGRKDNRSNEDDAMTCLLKAVDNCQPIAKQQSTVRGTY